LELWLTRTIQQGILKQLPLYYPMGKLVGQPPEQYARALLVGLQESGGDVRTRERTRDDGRAFRSWAESAPSLLEGSDQLRSVS
jgi:hypothetical protein